MENNTLDSVSATKVGLQTSNNERFIRLWHEISFTKMRFGVKTTEQTMTDGGKWYPHNKGGEYRKWYRNNHFVVNWWKDGYDIKKEKADNLAKGLIEKKNSKCWNSEYYFQKHLTWSRIGFSTFGVRYSPIGFVFDTAGTALFAEDVKILYIEGLLNSKIAYDILQIINPTLNYQTGDVARIPFKYDSEKSRGINGIVMENNYLSCEDWDNFETSWDFQCHPMI